MEGKDDFFLDMVVVRWELIGASFIQPICNKYLPSRQVETHFWGLIES